MAKNGPDFHSVMSDLKAKNFKSVYLLHGEEGYYIDAIEKYMEENVVDEADRDFDQTVIYGSDYTMKDAIMECQRYPMMAEKHLVILKEAQQVRDIEALEAYAKSPMETTIFVVCYMHKKVERTGVIRAVEKVGVSFQSDKPYDNMLGTFINNYTKDKGKTMSPQAVALLKDNIGSNLQVLAGEIDKLVVAAGDAKSISDELVMKSVTLNIDFNVFEFRKALADKNASKAYKLLLAAPKGQVVTPVVIASLFPFFVNLIVMGKNFSGRSDQEICSALKIIPFQMKEYRAAQANYDLWQMIKVVDILRKFDGMSKGVGSSGNMGDEEMLREMVYEITHCNGRTDQF